MDEFIPFASREYFIFLAVALFARGMDFLSTWIATPHMVLEGNPIAKWLGWKWGIVVNITLCTGLALLPLAAIIITTTSLFVAARNFQGAWLMRSMGEDAYRIWMSERLSSSHTSLFLFCLFAQCTLIAGIGTALLLWSDRLLVPVGIGVGLISYALAVLLYTLLSLARRRHGGIKVDS